jgi:hypothetical protein
MSKSILPEILSKLEPYLEEIDKQWEAQPEDNRHPTLPSTVDGKVNVRDITKAIGLRQSQEQHFFKKPEIASLVNALAKIQGIKPIGSRAVADQIDKVVSNKLSKVSSEKNDLARTLAEKDGEIEALRAEIASLKAKIEFIENTGLMIRE